MTEPDPVLRVVVADDQRSVREALGTLLDVSPGFEVAGLAADGAEAVAMAAELRPDVVLMDLRMPRCDGTEATRRIMTEAPGVRVVVLTTALEAGASGYLTKDAGREQIALAVRSAAAGQTVLDPAVQATLLASATRAGGAAAAPRPPASVDLPDGMTEREGDVLRLVAGGRTNSEIATELFVAEATVKTHINNLFAKTHVRSRAEAVQYAYRHGLVGPG
jgi:DNA-binding NarL/FixJ family response regulator